MPAGTIEKYKATDGWRDFLNIVEGDGSGPNLKYDLNGDGKISTADIQVIINEMKK